jgi:hypothetical protein
MRYCGRDDPELATKPCQFKRISRRRRRQVQMRVPVPDERYEPHEPDDYLVTVQLWKCCAETAHFGSETLLVDRVECIGMNSWQLIGKKLQVSAPCVSPARHSLLPCARGERQLKHETTVQHFDHELSL